MSTTTVYIKIEQKVLIENAAPSLGEIAQVWCSDKVSLSKCRALKVCRLEEGVPSRTILSIWDIVRSIQESDSSLEVQNLGEQDFILVYKPKKQSGLWLWIKTAIVFLILFFGSAFAIMTFNNDVDVAKVFDQLFLMVTGHHPTSTTPMEWGYIIGLPLGILGFYNHFSLRKRNADPTPLQIQMRQYEKSVNTTVIENFSRSEKEKT